MGIIVVVFSWREITYFGGWPRKQKRLLKASRKPEGTCGNLIRVLRSGQDRGGIDGENMVGMAEDVWEAEAEPEGIVHNILLATFLKVSYLLA